MANNSTGAIVEVDGDVSGLKKAMEDGARAVRDFEIGAGDALRGMQGAFGQLDNALDAIKLKMSEFSFIMNAIGLGAIGAGMVTSFKEMHKVARDWAEVGDEARERGINAEFYQALKIQATQFNVEQKDVTAGLSAFKDAMGELDDETSDSADAVGKFSKTLLEQLKGETDVEKQLRLVANALKASTDETERGTLAAALFGKEHAQVAEILLGGEKGLDAWMARAKASGQIVDNESVDAAKRLKFALDALADSPGIRAVEGILIQLTALAAKSMGSLQILTVDELNTKLSETQGQIERYRRALDELKEMPGFTDQRGMDWKLGQDIKDMWSGKWSTEREQMLSLGPTGAEQKIRELEGEAERIRAMLSSRSGWEARSEAAKDYESKSERDADAADTTAADKWFEAMNIKMLRDSGDFYAAIETQRQQDLAQFDKYVEKLGDAWENQAAARLAIEAKYNAEMRKQFEKEYVQPVSSAISSDLERAFSSWMSKGKMDWRELANSMIQDIAKIALRMAVLQPLFGGGATGGTGLFGTMVSGMFGPTASANGNIFDGGALVPFADGGIISQPSIFNMRDGQTGLMGEAGPEAIVPLSRGSDGRLGVAMQGGGQPINVNFTVNATDAASFRQSEGQLTAMISRAVARGNRGM